jgi:hypothetical protein
MRQADISNIAKVLVAKTPNMQKMEVHVIATILLVTNINKKLGFSKGWIVI